MIKSLHKTQRRTHMSHLDSTLELIGIKDKNVSLDENFFALTFQSKRNTNFFKCPTYLRKQTPLLYLEKLCILKISFFGHEKRKL